MEAMKTFNTKIKILGVDDRQENLLALEAILDIPGTSFIKALSGQEALSHVLNHEFALILMDVQMPEMDGFETAEIIRGYKKTQNIPIIFVTAIDKEQQHVFKGYDAGAVDYMFKPLEPYILRSKVEVFIKLFQQNLILKNKAAELERANKQILEQQNDLIEKERMKVALQMAGATAHESNSPLMILLGNIELMRYQMDTQKKEAKYIQRIYESGQKIAKIVEKVRNIQEIELKAYPGDKTIIDLDKST